MPGATVTILSYPDFSVPTDSNGEFIFHDVPAGLCEIEAFKANENEDPWKTSKPKVDYVPANGELYTVLILTGPNPDNRLVSLGVTIIMTDYPPFASAEGTAWNIGYIEEVFVPVRPGVTSQEVVVSSVVRYVRGEARVSVTGNADRSVTIAMRARMYDGNDVDDDWVESKTYSFNAPENAEREAYIRLEKWDDMWICVNALNRVDPAG